MLGVINVITKGGKAYVVENNSGVRTGDTAGPDLFLLCMLAVVNYIDWPEGGAPTFKSYSGHTFTLQSSVYADDFFLLFRTRAALADGLGRLVRAIKDLTGMSVHFATSRAEAQDTGSKTVAMCCPRANTDYDTYDTSPLEIDR